MAPAATDYRRYLMTIQREHQEILGAIRAHSPARARAAMRRHLLNSRKRYSKLAADLADQ